MRFIRHLLANQIAYIFRSNDELLYSTQYLIVFYYFLFRLLNVIIIFIELRAEFYVGNFRKMFSQRLWYRLFVDVFLTCVSHWLVTCLFLGISLIAIYYVLVGRILSNFKAVLSFALWELIQYSQSIGSFNNKDDKAVLWSRLICSKKSAD